MDVGLTPVSTSRVFSRPQPVPTRKQDSRETQDQVLRWYPAFLSLLAPVASPPGCRCCLLSPTSAHTGPRRGEGCWGEGGSWPLLKQHPAPLFPPQLRSRPSHTPSQASPPSTPRGHQPSPAFRSHESCPQGFSQLRAPTHPPGRAQLQRPSPSSR